MSYGPLVVGVDGGATKTIALVANQEGEVLGAARGPGSNLYSGAAEQAVNAVASTVRTAVQKSRSGPGDLAVGTFSLSGADWDEDIAYWEDELTGRRLARRVRVVNDSIGALYAGCPAGNGVAVVCGTGFTVSARSAQGRLWAGGHWPDWASSQKRGYLGGRAMAEAAVRAVVDQELELGPPTALRAHRSID